MSILNMSLTGGVFILTVLFLRAIFQNYVPRRTFLILWLAANALLLVPFRFRLPVSVYGLVDRQSVPVQAAAAAVEQSAPGQTLPWWRIVWIAGGAVLLAVVLTAHARNLWRFRRAEPVEPHPAEVPAGIRVKRLSGLPSPLVYRLIHPTILLPDEDFADPEQLRHIYLHELCHVRHLDVLRRYLMLLALAVHWFNPLVWVMYYVASQDMEMRCDAQVIRQLGAKKPYATTLVAMETGKLHHLLDAGFSFSSTGSRLKAILKAKRLPVISAGLAVVLCVTSLAVFGTDAAKQAPMAPEQSAVQNPAPEETAPKFTPEAPTPQPEVLETKPEPEPEPEEAELAALEQQPQEAAASEPQKNPVPPAADISNNVPETDSRQSNPSVPQQNGDTVSAPVPQPQNPEPEPEPEETAPEEPELDSYAASIEKLAQEQRDRMYKEQVEYIQKVQQPQPYIGAEPEQPQQTPGWSSALPNGTVSYPTPMAAGNPFP